MFGSQKVLKKEKKIVKGKYFLIFSFIMENTKKKSNMINYLIFI